MGVSWTLLSSVAWEGSRHSGTLTRRVMRDLQHEPNGFGSYRHNFAQQGLGGTRVGSSEQREVQTLTLILPNDLAVTNAIVV
jgi:hypothetical protein